MAKLRLSFRRVTLVSAIALAASTASPTLANPLGFDGVRTPQFTVYMAGQTPGFTAGKAPNGIVEGPDGNVWFTEDTGVGGTPGIAKITPDGHVTEFPTGTYQSSRPLAIVAGADKNLWFTDSNAAAIGRITPQGHITLFKSGLSSGDVPTGLANGADGSLWFVSQGPGSYVGKIDSHGKIIEVAHLKHVLSADPSLAQDAHGTTWLTASNGNDEVLVRVDALGHTLTHVLRLQPGYNPCCVYESTQAFATRRDGSVWFANLFDANAKSGDHPLGDIDPSGLFSFVYTRRQFIGSIARGRGNDLWFADQDPFYRQAAIGTVGPRGGLRIFPMPSGISPLSLTVTANGTLWMSGSSGSGEGGILIRATP